jgi:hypothetical protein
MAPGSDHFFKRPLGDTESDMRVAGGLHFGKMYSFILKGELFLPLGPSIRRGHG